MTVIVEQYLPSILMTIIGLWLTSQDRKRTEAIKKQNTYMHDWFTNVADCITANNDGTLALAQAIQEGNTNGKLTSAVTAIETANGNFEQFIRKMGIENLAKR